MTPVQCILGAGQSPRRFLHTNSEILLIFLALLHLKSLNNDNSMENIYSLCYRLSVQKPHSPFPMPVLAGGCLACCRVPDRGARRVQVLRGHVPGCAALPERCRNGATITKRPLYCCFPRLLACGD